MESALKPSFRGGGPQGQSGGRSGAAWKPSFQNEEEDLAAVYTKRFADVDRANEMDSMMGFVPFSVGPPRVGWMINMAQTYVKDGEWPGGRSAVDYYFLQEDGEYFKCTLVSSPYFFIKCKTGMESDVEDGLRKRFEKVIERVERVPKEDLDFPNHLAGHKRSYLKLSFRNVNDLDKVKRVLQPIAQRQGENYRDGVVPLASVEDVKRVTETNGSLNNIVDVREHDVPYALRVSIDYGICVGLWYTVRVGQKTQITLIREKDVRPDPVILAWDIETSKSPLKFPDSQVDPIMMISYMINGQGFLITNRDIVSSDIEDFEYTPKPDYPGTFTVFNELDERALLNRFFGHIQQMRPTVMVTYNGDFFDFPYVEQRALVHGMDMEAMIGFKKNNQGDYWSTHCLHLDCFRWVKRDSYLPAGSQGLKAVTSAKLGYDPLELDPELMTPLAASDPQTLANYSVSDAVATFYLYMKYVHPFIFSLCNIIPLNPDDVLRKGSGTLCETLLMAEAYRANVIMPNKHADGREKFFAGHLIESETYIGGHVEALEAGVFRSDIEYRFHVDPETIQQLINDLDRALTFSLKAEGGVQDLSLVTNYDEVKADILRRLEMLRDHPNRSDRPLIYHLDVAAMYPNIILTNRLQPTAMVDEGTCAMCDHNRPGKTCQRSMTWNWRGELYTAKRNEYRMIKAQLESEQFPLKRGRPGQEDAVVKMVPYHALPEAEQKTLLQKRLAEYSQKVYRRVRKTEVVQRTSIVCQKEHAFYIDTVRSFRDRRYDYKGLHKKAKKMVDDAVAAGDAVRIEECKKLVVLYDSLQLAHKCILNSFYGYVMRKGARWYSMEMAGIVCATGSSIIQLARQLVERVGRPLELDTDGIWCMLPWDFPQGYSFKLSNGKSHAFDYPCVMLNHLVHDKFTNDQYQTLVDPATRIYRQSSENSIFFEIDGPYRAMIIPSSTEENKLLKKRYAVFNENGSLAELKGFEVKRRGELKCLKVFQTQIFKVYLEGRDLAECYQKVAEVADYWLDILHGHGRALEDHDLVDLISENRSMSKSLEEYGEQKSTSISTARRLAEFLGEAMVKDRGLACKFIISQKPVGLPVAQRAIPLAIFAAEEPVKKHYLRKWLRDPGMTDFDMRSIIDWGYYLERLGSMIQKLIVIPAALQSVPNPVARVAPPDWLVRRSTTSTAEDGTVRTQLKITSVFKPKPVQDVEDIGKPKDVKSIAPAALPIEPVKAKPAPVALMEKDYSAWIAGSKAYWRSLRDNQSAPTSDKSKPSKSAFGRLAEGDKDLISRTPWQIVRLQETGPGQYTVWAILSGSPHVRQFNLSVTRTIYLHLSCSLEDVIAAENATGLDALLTRVYRKLPDGTDAQWLYAFSLPEATFQHHFYALSQVTSMPQLLSVYEDGLDLGFQMATRLGSCTLLSPHVRRLRDAQSRFVPDDLDSSTNIPYLTQANLQYISVLHFSAGDARHLVLLGIGNRYRLLLVESGMRRQLPTNLKSLLPSTLPKESALQPDRITVEADMYADAAALQRSLNRAIQEVIDSRTGPVIILSYSQHDTHLFNEGLSVAVEVPAIIPEASLTFPALDWQRTIGRRAFAVQQALGPWLQSRLSLARYAHVPLGTLTPFEDDESVYAFVADVFFARALQRAGHLLWSGSASTGVAAHETVEGAPSIQAAALYRAVCVEAELTGLAINAVMEHAMIAVEDQATGVALTATDSGTLGVTAAHQQGHSGPLLLILKRLLTGWLREHVQGGQEHAGHLAGFLHRWVVSGQSRLHWPPLARRLQSIINRTLGLLIARLHSFGCLVVHVDASRVVLRTSRQEYAAAYALVEWIQRELKKQDAFGWIDFTPTTYWKLLLWMDPANYHGLAYEEANEEAEEEPACTPVMKWTIAEYLPPALQPIFKRLVQEYLHLLPNEDGDGPKDDEAEELDGPSSDFAQLFLRVLREAQKYFFATSLPESTIPDRCFPDLLGSRLAPLHGSVMPVPRAALLEFIKCCSAVFLLDKDRPQLAEHLMKVGYGLLGIRQFSDQVQWALPYTSLVLQSVICTACSRSADIDLCLSQPTCPACAHPYDPAMTETRLIDFLQDRLRAYQVQDLACRACGPGLGIKADCMQPSCTRCSTPYQLTWIKQDELAEQVQVLRRLAPAMSMRALAASLDSIRI